MFRLGEIVKIKDSIADDYKINQSYGVVIKVYLGGIYEIRMMELHFGPPEIDGDSGAISHYRMGLEGDMMEHV
jgi:hypothetical protein